MANPFVAVINKIPHPTGERSIYEVILPTERINVTMTSSTTVAEAWVHNIAIVQPNNFCTLGVVVKGNQVADVLILCAGLECLIFQLNRTMLSRDVIGFLQETCTCYGWQINEYSGLLAALRGPRISLGRLTDVRSIVPGSSSMGLGDLSSMYLGYSIPEPVVSDWSPTKRKIRDTVLEAYICQVIGSMHQNESPNNFLPQIGNTYPQINLTDATTAKINYQVSIGPNRTLRVTYTTRAHVLVSWLRSLGREMQTVLVGIDVNQDHRGRDTVIALACGDESILLNLRKANYGSLVPEAIFGFLDSICPFVGWNIQDINRLGFGINPNRVFNIRDEFPNNSYQALARSVLGYEMARLVVFPRDPEEDDIMKEAVQAYVCLMGGMSLAYQNRNW